MKASLLARDAIDSTRKYAPLKKADGALEIDSTALTLDQVVETVLVLLPAEVSGLLLALPQVLLAELLVFSTHTKISTLTTVVLLSLRDLTLFVFLIRYRALPLAALHMLWAI